MFKFKLGQTVWYMKENKVHSAQVGSRTLCEVDEAFTKTRAGNSWTAKIMYGTIDGNWYENQLFASFDDLVCNLKANSVVG